LSSCELQDLVTKRFEKYTIRTAEVKDRQGGYKVRGSGVDEGIDANAGVDTAYAVSWHDRDTRAVSVPIAVCPRPSLRRTKHRRQTRAEVREDDERLYNEMVLGRRLMQHATADAHQDSDEGEIPPINRMKMDERL
jgi:hypothetical protein